MKLFTHVYHFLVLVIVIMAMAVVFIFYSSGQLMAVETPPPAQTYEMTGWGWTDTIGWISLNCNNIYAGENDGLPSSHCGEREDNQQYAVTYSSTSGQLSGNMWSHNIGWISFLSDGGGGIYGQIPTVDDGDLYPHMAELDTDTNILSGWAVATFNDDDPNNNAWIRFRAGEECQWGTAAQKDTFCTRMNGNNRLVGWAWSGGDNGFGWIQFEDTFSGGPYLQTQYSDIYSGGIVSGSQAPEGSYNATYCILSAEGDSFNLTSSQSCLLGDIDLDFPTGNEQQVYQSSIVNLDLASLQALAITNDTYYDEQELLDANLPIDGKLNNNVLYFTGAASYSIDSSYTFRNSESLGAGTIVIDGDLYINQNLEYEQGLIDNLEGLASVAFIVLGDVYVDETVSDVVGSYIVLGDTGIFYTGDDSDIPIPDTELFGNQFVLHGMVIAKEISLDRVYFEGLAAAEIFVYDGRVLVNTPPGLVNIVGYLPNWIR